MTPLRLIEIALAAWYLSYAVAYTHGPFGIFNWLRIHYPLGGLTICILCLMPWIALSLWLIPDGVIVWALAAAGLGLMLHGLAGWRYNHGQ